MKTRKPPLQERHGSNLELSIAAADPERRIGLPSAPMTHVNHVATFGAATACTVVLYMMLARLPDNPVTESLMQRGWVPYAIVTVTLWCTFTLAMKALKIRGQSQALRIDIIPEDPQFVLSPATAVQVLRHIASAVDDPRRFMVLNRVQIALSNMKNMLRIGDVREVLDAQADSDEASVDASYTIVTGLLWMIPIFGFVGTVQGLAAAIGRFGAVLEGAAEIEALKSALRAVTANLAIAFDTTLQGLLGALIVHFLVVLTRRMDERLLDDCREYCQRHIIGRTRIATSEHQGAEDA